MFYVDIFHQFLFLQFLPHCSVDSQTSFLWLKLSISSLWTIADKPNTVVQHWFRTIWEVQCLFMSEGEQKNSKVARPATKPKTCSYLNGYEDQWQADNTLITESCHVSGARQPHGAHPQPSL